MSETMVIVPTCPKCGCHDLQHKHRSKAEVESGRIPVKCKRCGHEFYLE